MIGRRPHTDIPGADYQRGDAADPDFVQEVWERMRPEVVFHLAGHVTGKRNLEHVQPTFRDILQSTVNVLTASTEVGCERVILAGSMEEHASGELNDPPQSPYAAAKRAGTLYARLFNAMYQTPIVNLRTFMVYGPGQEDWKKLIPYVTVAALNGQTPQLSSGRRLIDWIYLDDVVEAYLAAANAPASDVVGRVLDVGSGEQTSIREIVEMLTAIIDPEIVPVFGARDDRPLEVAPVADLAPTRKYLGWQPTTPLRVGLEETVQWIRGALDDQGSPPRGA